MVTLEKILNSVELTKSQKAAVAKLFGPEYIEGAIYKRVAPPNGATEGDLYIACKKLGKGENGESGFDMLNLTRKDRQHVLATFSPEKFVLVAKSAAGVRLS